MYKIRKETQNCLAAHGLMASVYPASEYKSPVDNHKSIFVRESRFNKGYGFGDFSGIEDIKEQRDLVIAFCEEEGMSEKDIYWKPVFEDRAYGVSFSLHPISETRLEYATGFIYITKSDAVSLFSDNNKDAVAIKKSINSEIAASIAVDVLFIEDIKKYVDKMFANNLKELSFYMNREIFDIEVFAAGELTDKRHGVIDVDQKRVDETIVSIVENSILDIENGNKDKINLKLTWNPKDRPNHLAFIHNTEAMAEAMRHIKKKHGFMPLFGALKPARLGDAIVTTVLVDSLPKIAGEAEDYTDMDSEKLKSALTDLLLVGDRDEGCVIKEIDIIEIIKGSGVA